MNKQSSAIFNIALLVNPWAGFGGALALKGSDGDELRDFALSRRAQFNAHKRVEHFLEALLPYASSIHWVCCPDSMGAQVIEKVNAEKPLFTYELIGQQCAVDWQRDEATGLARTSSNDTRFLMGEILGKKVDLLVFAGGDGTARDIAEVVGSFPLVSLGIPCGVKMHSGVFARSPMAAAKLVESFVTNSQISIIDADVRDIDEDALRAGVVNSRYFSTLKVPVVSEDSSLIQASKNSVVADDDAIVHEEIAAYIMELIEQESKTILIIGAGTSTQALKRVLGDAGTLLGVDVYIEGALRYRDANETDILRSLEEYPVYSAHILVSFPGSQGIVFGRGNQQLSPTVIRSVLERANKRSYRNSDEQLAAIEILASEQKLKAINGESLFVDTGDDQLDSTLEGSYQVICNYQQRRLCKLIA